jgi:hypothetical protein
LKKKSLGFFQELFRNRTPLPSMCAPGAGLAAATGFLDESLREAAFSESTSWQRA